VLATTPATVRLIITRPAAQAAQWVQQLSALGVDAVTLPLIDIAAVSNLAPLHQAWHELPRYALVMFVSANAVVQFFAAASVAVVWPHSVRAGATGPGTTAALLTAGVPASHIVAPGAAAVQFDTEALWAELAQEPWHGREVLVVRGEDGRDWLADTLTAAGARVAFLAAYARFEPDWAASQAALLAAALVRPHQHVWHFSSSQAVGHLAAQGQRLAAPADWTGSVAIASHPRIVQAARECGFGHVERVDADVGAVAAWWRAWALAQGSAAAEPAAGPFGALA